MKTFEELDCWKKSTELRRQLAQLVKGFPHEEKYKLTDQILVRASRSVTANIAEEFADFIIRSMLNFADKAGVHYMN